MTVRELIQELSQIKDQDVKVMVRGYEGGIDDAIIQKDESSTPAIYTIKRNKNDEWYLGRHEVVEQDTPLKKDNVERAIILVG
jgi:hypothetical protein